MCGDTLSFLFLVKTNYLPNQVIQNVCFQPEQTKPDFTIQSLTLSLVTFYQIRVI